jgi:CO/xanthine dehydrogenase Mo-binding subunit
VRDEGDVDGVLRRGAPTLDATYEVPFLAHAPLEPQNCIVSVRGPSVEVWAPCQIPSGVQEVIAEALGVAAEDVLVHTTLAGGGFGRRGVADYAAQAALIARKVGRPVKLIWSRESDMTQGFYRPAAVVSVRGAVDDAGRVQALDVHLRSQPISLDFVEVFRGGQPRWMPAFMRSMSARSVAGLTASNTVPDTLAAEGARDTPYRLPHLRVRYTPIQTALPVGAWRSVGHSYTGFVVESAIDELAHAAGRDPVAFRLAHLDSGSREARVLERVARLAGWGAAPAGHAWGVARHTAFGSEAAEIAEVTLKDGRIRVTRVWAAIECGVVVNPDIVKAQIEGGIIFGLSAALDQAITLKGGEVQEKNYDRFPPLRMFECPRIEVAIVESAVDPTGVGEPGLPPIAPAVANALFALTGRRLRRLPLQRALDAEMSR